MGENPKMMDLMREHVHLAVNLRKMRIYFEVEKCRGIWQCIEVCPVGSWEMNEAKLAAVFVGEDLCIACGACVLQCPEDAIELK